MEMTVERLKERVKAGRGLVPAHKVIKGGQLVNVMSAEIYPADIAIYNEMIAAVGDVSAYIGKDTEIIDAKGRLLVKHYQLCQGCCTKGNHQHGFRSG